MENMFFKIFKKILIFSIILLYFEIGHFKILEIDFLNLLYHLHLKNN